MINMNLYSLRKRHKLTQEQLAEELNTAFKTHLQEFAAQAPKGKHPRFQIMWAGDAPFSFHTENTAGFDSADAMAAGVCDEPSLPEVDALGRRFAAVRTAYSLARSFVGRPSAERVRRGCRGRQRQPRSSIFGSRAGRVDRS